jgi:hypothetical protein
MRSLVWARRWIFDGLDPGDFDVGYEIKETQIGPLPVQSTSAWSGTSSSSEVYVVRRTRSPDGLRCWPAGWTGGLPFQYAVVNRSKPRPSGKSNSRGCLPTGSPGQMSARLSTYRPHARSSAASAIGCRWHGRGQGFESPKLHKSILPSQAILCHSEWCHANPSTRLLLT